MTCILVVEDEGDIREVLVEAISAAGYAIVEAATADAAVDLLGLTGLRLVVTDINLPGRLDGIDLAMAARHAHPDIPVLFISGRPWLLADARKLGDPSGFLQKPFGLADLMGDVERLAGAA